MTADRGVCDVVGCDQPAALYPIGLRCPGTHSPAATAGRTTPIPDPTRTLNGLRAAAGITWSYDRNTSALNDQRAIASGKRRSNVLDYQAAKAAQHDRKEHHPVPNIHYCHATGCTTAVPPKMLMCGRHWRLVPRRLQSAVWAHYRRGQEISKDPSSEYVIAARAAIDAVAKVEATA